MLFYPIFGVAWRCIFLSLSYGFGLVLRFTYSLLAPVGLGIVAGPFFLPYFFYFIC